MAKLEAGLVGVKVTTNFTKEQYAVIGWVGSFAISGGLWAGVVAVVMQFV